MARPVQVSSDGWATNRPMGGLGRIPIPRQKQLRGKTVKTRHDRQYKKRALIMHKGGKTRENRGEQRKGEEKHKRLKKIIREKEVIKRVKDRREDGERAKV